MLQLDYARRGERREVNILCDLVARNWDEALPLRVTDMSAHGLWIQTSFPLEVGEHAVIGILPPNSHDEMQLFARVVRSVRVVEHNGRRECGMALELVGVDAGERCELRRCLRGLPALRRRVSRVPLLPES